MAHFALGMAVSYVVAPNDIPAPRADMPECGRVEMFHDDSTCGAPTGEPAPPVGTEDRTRDARDETERVRDEPARVRDDPARFRDEPARVRDEPARVRRTRD
jgi:hypothetical protein